MRLRTPSFRTRILLVVLTVAVVPLALTGLWLARSAQRSGEELLRGRLDETIERTVSRIGNNWLRLRSDILFVGEHDDVQRALLEMAEEGDAARAVSAATGRPPTSSPPPGVRTIVDRLDPSVARVTIRDLGGAEVWTLERPDADDADRDPVLRLSLPVHQRFPSRELGSLVVDLRPEGLVGRAGGSPSVPGEVLSVADAATGMQLLPVPFEAAKLDSATFEWAGDEWITAHRRMSDPGVAIVAAAPLAPFAGAFEGAARRGTLWLALVATAGLLATYVLTRRMTRSLERLAAGAEAVSRGDLDAHIPDPGSDEVGRVAEAFNTMTASLRRTLRELASRERLAAVGEFAASLAHEVRNPLTAIRIDLQRVEESLPPDSPLREAQSRALREIGRLDATVSETLDVARTGRWRAGVDLTVPLRAAVDAAGPAFDERGATLDPSALNGSPFEIRGDEKSLEQLFLNLLLNAAGALAPEGRAWLELSEEDGEAIISVCDTGTGIEPDDLERIFEPLYTTRAEGTGLGLTVVRRIVDEHDGTIEIESEPGVGTTVRVRLPA